MLGTTALEATLVDCFGMSSCKLLFMKLYACSHVLADVYHIIHDALSLAFSSAALFCPVSIHQIVEL